MNPSVASKLKRLLESGSLPESECGRPLLRELRSLMESGVVRRERSSGGWRLAVEDGEALRGVLSRRLPSEGDGSRGRVAGVACYRDSKALPNDTPPVVVARVFRDVLRPPESPRFEAAAATRTHGVFAWVLGSGNTTQIEGSVALVENPAVFLRLEELGLDVDMALATHGRLHGRTLEWLSRQDHPRFGAWHLPDYDPTGLLEFGRLRRAMGHRVSLYQPPDLIERFMCHSNPRLLEGVQSRSALARLRADPLPEIQAVVDLIDRFNAGLEQESLLVPRIPAGRR